MNHSLVVLALVAVAGASSGAVWGQTNVGGGSGSESSGKVITDSRALTGSYRKIEISAPADVTFTIGPKSTLSIEGEDRIVKLIDTHIQNGVLIVTSPKFGLPHPKLVLTIANPSLDSVRLNGATNINLTGLQGAKLEISASGANKIVATGLVDSVTIRLSGAGNADLHGLKSNNAAVNISGTGDVSVNCAKSLSASISGMGNIRYTGKPAQVQKNISGMGKVTPM